MRIYGILFFLASAINCQPVRQVGDTEFTDAQRQRRFRLTPAKVEVLRRAANNRLPGEYRDNPQLLKRYDYWPIVVDQHFRGLWHFDNYSHEGPILVINGRKTATVFPLKLDKTSTLDSVNAALRKYSLTELNAKVRTGILQHIESIRFLR